MADLSVDGALSALNDVSSNAPAAAPEDREGAIIDDEENEQADADGDDAEASADDEQDNDDADSSDADVEGEADPDQEATDDAENAEDKAEEGKLPPIEPPAFLDATEREAFKSLPQAAQEILARQSKLATADYSRKTQEVAEKRKALDTRINALREVKTEKQARIEKWQKVDWAAMATKLSPQEWNRNKALMEKEMGEYRALESSLKRQEEADFHAHIAEESPKLKTVAPELYGDTKEAQARRIECAEAAIKAGLPRDRVKWMSANEMNFVYKALQWDKYQAEKAKKLTITAKKGETSKGRTIKPTSRTNAPAGAKGVVSKVFAKKPTQANAMSLLNALDD